MNLFFLLLFQNIDVGTCIQHVDTIYVLSKKYEYLLFSNEILLLLKKALYRGLLIQNIDCGYSLYIAGTSF